MYVSYRLRHLFSTPAQGVSPAPVFVLKSRASMSQSKFVLAVFGGPFANLFSGSPPRRKIFVSNLEKKASSMVYGARNLRRTIQRALEDPISERIIESFQNPISQIFATVENEQIVVTAK